MQVVQILVVVIILLSVILYYFHLQLVINNLQLVMELTVGFMVIVLITSMIRMVTNLMVLAAAVADCGLRLA